jgi:deazaflavin-dependent oxidoreductase (nitroreductase family)
VTTPPSDEQADRYGPVAIWLTTNPVTTWLIRKVFSRLDPLVFRATNGRLSAMGPASGGMLTLTTTGRQSGKPRSVQLGCVEHDGGWLVVASAMGQEQHPAWRYNLEANPEVEVQMRDERFRARARVLTDAEKAAVWGEIRRVIPQIRVYERRTGRNIRVFRLTRADA